MTRLVSIDFLGLHAKIQLPICEPCLTEKATKKPLGKAMLFRLRVSPLWNL